MENDWALVVGINRYPFASGLSPLQGAARDAEKFFEWVTSKTGGDVPNDQVHSCLLTSPEPGNGTEKPRPVFSQIQQFIEDMQTQLAGRPGRRLYLFLSGHGISPISENAVRHAALLMANTRPPQDWHNFPGNVWAEGARNAARFREVVLIMDCCRDLQDKANVGTHAFGDAVDDGKACRLVELYAADWGSQAREGEFGEPKVRQGIFTHSLLEVLKAGRMNGRMLKESLLEHLSRKATPEQRFQKPDIRTDEELEALTFNEAAAPPMSPVAILNHVDPRPRVHTLPIGGFRTKQVDISSWVLKEDKWQGSLPPGNYMIRMSAGDDVLFRVYAGLPEQVDVLVAEGQ